MVETLPFGSAADIADVVGERARHITEALEERAPVQPKVGRKPLPLSRANVAKPILATNLHSETSPLQIEIVRENARDVVQGRESRAALGTDQQRVVLRMRVRSRDEPIESQRIDEPLDIIIWPIRERSQKLDDFARPWPTLVLVFPGREDREGLTAILLVYANNAGIGSFAIVTSMTITTSSSNRLTSERAVTKPSAEASRMHKCSFSACPSNSPVGGFRIWVVGVRPEGMPQRPFS